MNSSASRVGWIAIALIACGPAWLARADEPWKPFLEDRKGTASELGDPKKLGDKAWLSIRYTEYSGHKPRIAVAVFEDKAAYPPQFKNRFAKMIVALSGHDNALPQNHLEDLVRQALNNTNRFHLLERTSASGDLAAESALADSGRVEAATAVASGEIQGAEYSVKTTLIELNPEKETKEISAVAGAKSGSGLSFGGFGLKGKVAFCRVNVRVVRTETSEIVADQTVDGTARSTRVGLGGSGVAGLSGAVVSGAVGMMSRKHVPLSDAMQACANKAAYYVVTRLEQTPWQGTVSEVSGGEVTIVGGTDVGLREGMTLTLLSKGEDVVDPETQEVIGSETAEIGQVRVVAAKEKFSTCEIVQGGGGAKRGDVVRREIVKK